MRYFQHRSCPFPLERSLKEPEPRYVLGYEDGVFWYLDEFGMKTLSNFQSMEDCERWLQEGIWVEIPSNPFAPKQGVPEKPRCKDEDLDPYMTPMEEREHSLKNRLFTLLDEMKTFGTIVLDKPEWPNELFEEWKKK